MAWAAVILLITSVPTPDLGAASRFNFPGADKLLHALLYAVLGWLSGRAWIRPGRAWRVATGVGLAIALFAALDEWHQQFIPGRGADALDWLADLLGALGGLGLAVAAPRREHAT